MDAESVLREIAQQCAGLVRAGQAPIYVEAGKHQYAALEERFGHGFGDVEVDEPAGEVQAPQPVPVHFPVSGGKHVLGVTRVEIADHLRVMGSESMTRDLD